MFITLLALTSASKPSELTNMNMNSLGKWETSGITKQDH